MSVEGTGPYGVGLAQYLIVAGCTVIEVSRPGRQTRYALGKSDPVDVWAPVRAVSSGKAIVMAKIDTGHVGMIRALGPKMECKHFGARDMVSRWTS